MSSDIVVSIRYNNIIRIRQSKIAPDYNCKEEYITDKIRDLMRELEKEIKDLTTKIVEINDHEQKAMDIGKDILSLIEEKTEEKVNEIGICRG